MTKFTTITILSFLLSLPFAPCTVQAKGKVKAAPTPVTSSYSSASQSEFKHEIFVSGTIGQFTSGGGVTDMLITGMYGYIIQPKIEVAGSIDISNYSYKNVSRSGTALFAYGFYNFDEDLRNSFFAAAGVGTANVGTATGATESKFGFRIGGGKRFAFWNNVALTPVGWIQKIGDLDTQIVLVPLNISLFY